MDVDVTIVGAGVAGLAVAAELADDRCSVLVVEKHPSFGREASSRNSEVIHAGIYYRPGSLKAETCREGRDLLYDLCEREGLPHSRLGKLIVANGAEDEARLENIAARAEANGVEDLRFLDRAGVRALEAEVEATAALCSPSSGILSSHALMAWLEARALGNGADFAYRTSVVGLEWSGSAIDVETLGPTGERATHRSAHVVNAAGLAADAVAACAGIDVDEAGYRLRPWKGSYFSLAPVHAAIRPSATSVTTAPQKSVAASKGASPSSEQKKNGALTRRSVVSAFDQVSTELVRTATSGPGRRSGSSRDARIAPRSVRDPRRGRRGPRARARRPGPCAGRSRGPSS